VPVHNPAHPSEVVGFSPAGTRADAEGAVQAAVSAQREWARLPLEARVEYLAGTVEALEADTDRRAEVLATEQGKTIHEARLEIGFTGAIITGFLELAAGIEERTALDSPLARVEQFRRPRGVVAAFVPSNWPVAIAALKLVPALLAGNAVVLKPNPSCPLAVADAVGRVAAALPAGLVNLVCGTDEEVAIPLLEHPGVDHVSFTGSIDTGVKVMERCARQVKSLTLELGGNDPAIVLPDARFDRSFFDRMQTGVFATSGQVCLGIKRIYVPGGRLEEFLDGFLRSCDELVMGDPLDPEVTLGPVHASRQVERVQRMIGEAVASGASVRTVGSERPFDPEGFFVRPRVVVGLDERAELVREEQFAPVVPVLAYDDVEEAIDRANGTRYGLGSSLWTSDEESAYERYAPLLRAGTTFVNNHGIFAQVLTAPTGGVKQSGFGREFGVAGIYEYMTLQTVSNQSF
jgi:aldehyde dehydrogenase